MKIEGYRAIFVQEKCHFHENSHFKKVDFLFPPLGSLGPGTPGLRDARAPASRDAWAPGSWDAWAPGTSKKIMIFVVLVIFAVFLYF